jgi:hypothetical protein
MRSSLLARGASVTAAVLLLTACGGGSEDEEAASTTTAASSSAPSSAPETSSEAPGSGSEFCTEAAGIPDRIGSSFANSNDPQQLSEDFQTAADEIRNVEPPQEIADDWNALADGLEQASASLDGVDLTDPEAAARVQTELQGLQSQLTTAGGNVQTYLQEECGIDTGTSESPSADESEAAPSS